MPAEVKICRYVEYPGEGGNQVIITRILIYMCLLCEMCSILRKCCFGLCTARVLHLTRRVSDSIIISFELNYDRHQPPLTALQFFS